MNSAAFADRLTSFTQQLLPVYFALTMCLWLTLTILGDSAFVALCHSMSVMSTSGISPIGGISNAGTGFIGEVVIVGFLVLALSRRTFSEQAVRSGEKSLILDPEIRVALTVISSVTLFLFVRHWYAVYGVDGIWNIERAFTAAWGGLFMTISFMTTAGFESVQWQNARAWSALQAPGVLLAGLAIFGGGIATTAGGVKLLRVYALARHQEREISKLTSPNSVGGAGKDARRIRREGAQVAWVSLMVFVLSIAAVMIALSLFGRSFEDSAIFSIAALTTTGPMAQLAADTPLSYANLAGGEKLILSATMIMGRLELLALIALLNPDFWRR